MPTDFSATALDIFEKIPKDILVLIALSLDLSAILYLCSVSTAFNRGVCENNIFWIKKKDFNINYLDIGKGDPKIYYDFFEKYGKGAIYKQINFATIEGRKDILDFLIKNFLRNRLLERLATVTGTNKVLDVSRMNLINGAGVKIILIPRQNSRKIGVKGLAVVSNNEERYVKFLDFLGPDYTHFGPYYGTGNNPSDNI